MNSLYNLLAKMETDSLINVMIQWSPMTMIKRCSSGSILTLLRISYKILCYSELTCEKVPPRRFEIEGIFYVCSIEDDEPASYHEA